MFFLQHSLIGDLVGAPDWIVVPGFFLVFTYIAGLVYVAGGKDHIEAEPERAAGYYQIRRAWWIWGSLVWGGLLLSAAIEGGWPDQQVPFELTASNLVYHASLYVGWGVALWWICFAGGAELLIAHPGRPKGFLHRFKSPFKLKLFGCLMVSVGVGSLFFHYLGQLIRGEG